MPGSTHRTPTTRERIAAGNRASQERKRVAVAERDRYARILAIVMPVVQAEADRGNVICQAVCEELNRPLAQENF